MNKRIVIIGAGVAGINAATTLVDGGYPADLITIIDKGKDPYQRKPEQVMEGMLGAGGWSDGKLTYHTAIGGQLSKYCGDEKAMSLMKQVVDNFTRFHPKPEEIFYSDPVAEPDFIKPQFGLRLFPVWHIGSNYLHEIAINWYNYLVDKGIEFYWDCEVDNIDFEGKMVEVFDLKEDMESFEIEYDTLIFGAGKSGIDFSQSLITNYDLKTEPKSVQIGVRFEAPQKYFQKLIDISYDFKLYQKPNDDISLRTFCTNNNAAYVAVEETYGNQTYNGHAKKGLEFQNDMTNFGIIMEIKGIENPFEWSREVVQKCQVQVIKALELNSLNLTPNGISPSGRARETELKGMFYSPNMTRRPSVSSEGDVLSAFQVQNLNPFREALGQEYVHYILDFIHDMDDKFNFGDDWGIYIPEVKYVSPEPLVDYTNLTLVDYSDVHFVGDSLSARGITVSGAHGIYATEDILLKNGKI